jgi:hypothetical protein
MKVAIYLRVDAPSQQLIAQAVMEGCRRMGESAHVFSQWGSPEHDAECAVLFGIGGDAKQIYDAARKAGKRTVLLDKPYIRALKGGSTPRYHLVRVAVDGFQPLGYFQVEKRASDRWDRLCVDVLPYRKRKSQAILLDGASNKYVQWCGLGNGNGSGLAQWAEWGQRIVDTIREYTNRTVIYRPRPSHNETPLVKHCVVSERPLEQDFADCEVVVSHGGNIGFDAVIRGIPHFAIGESIARPLSQTDWAKVGEPFRPSDDERRQWLHDLAYCQWNLDEFRDGSAWRYIRDTMNVIDSQGRNN